MVQVKPESYSLLLICLALLIGSAAGLLKNRKDTSHIGYFYGAPDHGLKLPSLKEETKEVKEALEEAKEEIEREIEEKLEEDELLHFHSNEYIPPRHHGNERERRHGFRRGHGHHQ